MNDSTVSTAASVNLRNKGLRITKGSLIKGCVKDATTKLSIGSIPSNFEKIIYQNVSTKAFGTSQRRFFQAKPNEGSNLVQGEASYCSKYSSKMNKNFANDWKGSKCQDLQAEDEQGAYMHDIRFRQKHSRQSHSVKGFGPFVSKEERMCFQKRNGSPGPGRYQCTKTADYTQTRNKRYQCDTKPLNFNNNKNPTSNIFRKSARPNQEKKMFKSDKVSSADQSQLPKQKQALKSPIVVKHQIPSPGPGQYNLLHEKSRNIGSKSAFKTKVDRFSYIENKDYPGPGYYDVKLPKHAKSIIKEKEMLSETNKYTSDFSPKKAEQYVLSLNHQASQDNKQNRRTANDKGVPGPGSYYYDIPNFRPLYQRIKISGNFMMTKKDRFNNVMQVDPTKNFQQEQSGQDQANVCSYDLKSSFDNEKRLLQWPCFMSESKRHAWKKEEQKLGPSFLITDKSGCKDQRKNFHFNIKGDWF